MKIRSGFVSNSSSSSFICNFCGGVESGYDCCLSDFDMTQCEHGHTFCNNHITKEFIPTIEEQHKKLKAYFEDNLNSNQETLEKYKNRLANSENKLNSWEESCISRDTNYLQTEINRYENLIQNNKSNLEYLEQSKNEGELPEHFVDLFNDLIEEEGIPEEYCPVCLRKKEMEQDPDYNKYKELYDKFNGVDPEGCKF